MKNKSEVSIYVLNVFVQMADVFAIAVNDHSCT